jgi:hypothetical protein
MNNGVMGPVDRRTDSSRSINQPVRQVGSQLRLLKTGRSRINVHLPASV